MPLTGLGLDIARCFVKAQQTHTHAHTHARVLGSERTTKPQRWLLLLLLLLAALVNKVHIRQCTYAAATVALCE